MRIKDIVQENAFMTGFAGAVGMQPDNDRAGPTASPGQAQQAALKTNMAQASQLSKKSAEAWISTLQTAMKSTNPPVLSPSQIPDQELNRLSWALIDRMIGTPHDRLGSGESPENRQLLTDLQRAQQDLVKASQQNQVTAQNLAPVWDQLAQHIIAAQNTFTFDQRAGGSYTGSNIMRQPPEVTLDITGKPLFDKRPYNPRDMRHKQMVTQLKQQLEKITA